MRKILAIAIVCLFAVNSVNAQVGTSTTPVDPGFNFIYDQASGELSWLSLNSDLASTYEIVSASNGFVGEAGDFKGEDGAALYSGIFDLYTPEKAFTLKPGGFGSVQTVFAKLAPGLFDTDVAGDLAISGAKLPEGPLAEAAGGVWIVAPAVPEPSSIALLGIGILGLLRFRRK